VLDGGGTFDQVCGRLRALQACFSITASQGQLVTGQRHHHSLIFKLPVNYNVLMLFQTFTVGSTIFSFS